MAILVKKFGGSSVATPEKIHGIVNRVLKEKKPGDKIVIVVSAMGDSTDDLLALAGRVNPEMPKRELDMLLATGEQVTIALMAGAFWAKGQPAVSFTGAQAGIKTNDKYSKASIINVEAERVQKALDEGNVVIVAGFQGITGSGDITTLAAAAAIQPPLPLQPGLMQASAIFIPMWTAFTLPIRALCLTPLSLTKLPLPKCWNLPASAQA